MKKTFPIGKYLFEVDFDFENKKAHFKEINNPGLAGYFDLANNNSINPGVTDTADQTYQEALGRLLEKIQNFGLKS